MMSPNQEVLTMRRMFHVAAWLPAIGLIVGTVAAVTAFEIPPGSLRDAIGNSADQSPRYLRHDEQSARPVPGTASRPNEVDHTDSLAPRLRATEQLTSGESGEVSGRLAAGGHREI